MEENKPHVFYDYKIREKEKLKEMS